MAADAADAADTAETVDEIDESDNTASASISVGSSQQAGPNLEITYFDYLADADSVYYYVDIVNAGSATRPVPRGRPAAGPTPARKPPPPLPLAQPAKPIISANESNIKRLDEIARIARSFF